MDGQSLAPVCRLFVDLVYRLMTSICLLNESCYSNNSQIFVISHQLEMGSMFFTLQYLFKVNVTMDYSVPK